MGLTLQSSLILGIREHFQKTPKMFHGFRRSAIGNQEKKLRKGQSRQQVEDPNTKVGLVCQYMVIRTKSSPVLLGRHLQMPNFTRKYRQVGAISGFITANRFSVVYGTVHACEACGSSSMTFVK